MIFGVNISKAPLEDLLATGDNGAVLWLQSYGEQVKTFSTPRKYADL